MRTLKELTGLINAKGDFLGQVFDQAGDNNDFDKVTCLQGKTTTDKVAEVKTIEKELSSLHDEYRTVKGLVDSRKAADEAVKFAGEEPHKNDPAKSALAKSLGEKFIKSAAFTNKGATSVLDVDLKTLVRTGAGWAPESMRLSRTELYPLRELRVADAFPTYTTGLASIKYMEETTHTNNAAEIAEETNAAAPTAYGEAALVMTERSVTVEKIAVWIPITDEQLSDVEGIEGFINDRLTYMIRNRLDGQLIAGDGNTPNLRGVLNAANIQTQAKSTDSVPDAIFKAMTKVRGVSAGTGFGLPNVAMFHPNDWQVVRLLTTADGIYIFGSPTDAGPDRIWGLPVVVTSAVTENTAIVGDFANFAGLFVRNGVEIKVTDSHGELFTAGVQAIKATMRCAAVYFRGSAFCKVTGI